jgi:hypothetical protein
MGKQKQKHKKQNTQQYAQQHAQDASLLGAKVNSESEAGNGAKRESEAQCKEGESMGLRERLKRSSITDWLLILFTAVIAGATIYQFIILGGQLDVMRKDQRPWIRVRVEVQPLPVVSPIMTGTGHVRNSGKTPAKNPHAYFFFEKIQNGTEPRLDKLKADVESTTGVLFPDEPYDVPLTIYSLSATEFDEFNREKIFFVVYGRLTYTDFYNVEHWTKFCQFIGLHGTATAKPCADYGDLDSN